MQVKIGVKWYYTDITTDLQFIKKKKNVLYCLVSEEEMKQLHVDHYKIMPGEIRKISEFSFTKDKLYSIYNKYIDKRKM